VTATDVVVLIHALIGILFVAGLVGRWIVLGLAARATELPAMRTLTAAAGPFERIVILGSILVTVFGVVAAFMQGRSILGPLTGGTIDWLFVSVVLVLSIVALVPLVFLPRGKIFEAALANAQNENRVTPDLIAAWKDPIVRAAHIYELGAITVVLILMLAKPF
jgi:hypothetical protein